MVRSSAIFLLEGPNLGLQDLDGLVQLQVLGAILGLFHQDIGLQPLALVVFAVLLVALTACKKEQDSTERLAIIACEASCLKHKGAGEDLSRGPCLPDAAMPEGWGQWFYQGFSNLTTATHGVVTLIRLAVWVMIGAGLIGLGWRLAL